ncbi:hypothetical protein LEP1GSC202_0046 [Leptospira yanagawae serovar Saopaulo str. Sao Paulo = ATCC 700523]|uniref:Uncharacterized protein n=1 Tax=Leptospira yanagawae serovar Saopaulo str. Sao Paulo = ATCC 700523 TaxID=1249483 RepID=A0A5E8H7B7_9LEPT|nr:hypothetical protein [Leptospira yanagawae]EOQ87054.1 hypothetical protein LEP1GSC202_0046 [Leptospira yanagawae serovar Saopaulo str. Sao Paulo = ATCC 700523]
MRQGESQEPYKHPNHDFYFQRIDEETKIIEPEQKIIGPQPAKVWPEHLKEKKHYDKNTGEYKGGRLVWLQIQL